MNDIATKDIKATELVTLTQEFNAPKDVAMAITQGLGRFFAEAKAHEATIQSIVITSPSQTDKMQVARTIRLQIRAKRLEAQALMKDERDKIKTAMADYTLKDKLWLKAFQMLEAVCDNLETKAEEKEKFAERWKADQKEKRTNDRLIKLSEYTENDQYTDRNIVDNMNDDAFDRYFGTIKAQHEARIEAEKKAEAERIAREEAEAAERKRILIENERLRKEAEQKEAEHIAERKASEAKAMAEREELERKAAEQKRIADEALAKERAEREKLQSQAQAKLDAEIAELKAKEDAERKAEAESKKAAKAPDADKLRQWVVSFVAPICLELSTDEAKLINTTISEKFESFKTWATKQTENL